MTGAGFRRLLALETATSATAVAVLDAVGAVDGSAVVSEVVRSGEAAHARVLIGAVEEALGAAGFGLDAVDAFALSIGPGSFTGLRIGLATVKAFALGTGRPLACVPTLAGIAWAAGDGDSCVPVLDARRGEVYAGAWRRSDEGLAPELAEGVWTPAELADALAAAGVERCRLVGEGLDPHGPALEAALAARGLEVVADAAAGVRAAAIAQLGARMLRRGEGIPAQDAVPHYLRRAEAEVKRTGQRFELPPAASPAGRTL